MQKEDPFVICFPQNLSKDVCDDIINLYEIDASGHYPGVTFKGHDPTIKNTVDIFITNRKGWDKYDKLMFEKLNDAIKQYVDMVPPEYQFSMLLNNVSDRGYQIQKYYKNDGFYVWHNDYDVDNQGNYRILTFLWYLNDVLEGGETEFINGQKIKPEAGKLLLFPSTWIHRHRGNIPISNDKYIITGWIYVQFPNDKRFTPRSQEEMESANKQKRGVPIHRSLKRKLSNGELVIDEKGDSTSFSITNKDI